MSEHITILEKENIKQDIYMQNQDKHMAKLEKTIKKLVKHTGLKSSK